LSQLSFFLGSLKLDDDAVLISNWVVRLSRILLGHEGNLEATTDLARNLLNYSIDLQAIGDDYASLAAIQEAYEITQIQVQNVHDTPIQVLLLHCLVLEHYALTLSDLQSDSQQPLELVKESVRITESVLAASTGLNFHTMIGSDLDLLGQLDDVASSKDDIVKYAQARSVYANLLATDGQSHEALTSMRLGLRLYRIMSLLDTEITPQLASALYKTIVGDIGENLSVEERLDYTNECIDIYRDLVYKNPIYYMRLLINVLWAKAEFLRTMHRHDEALEAWKEVVHLAKQLSQDDRLYTEALNNLSHQFRILNRYDDAAST
jgi:tetratricopeptide (TPR) repeat protein